MKRALRFINHGIWIGVFMFVGDHLMRLGLLGFHITKVPAWFLFAIAMTSAVVYWIVYRLIKILLRSRRPERS